MKLKDKLEEFKRKNIAVTIDLPRIQHVVTLEEIGDDYVIVAGSESTGRYLVPFSNLVLMLPLKREEKL